MTDALASEISLRPDQLELPAELPVSQHADALIESLRRHPVTIVCGATGSGKSTQLPKLALRAGRRSIAHTQPRRLAARTLAERIASEVRCKVGDEVGWQVRFAQAVSEKTCVKLMTDGVLLSELRHNKNLSKYDTIIIDEAHERSLNIDFLLGCLHRLLETRKDLRLVITSATLDAEKFSKHFNDAPIFMVEGRSYPVEVRYREPPKGDLETGIAESLRELWKSGPGDVLVFLPGEREIRDLRDGLPRRTELARYGDAEFLPLYARLPAAQQQRIFNPAREGRRVILATNVAETSLTVPGIRYVIDSGLARIARFSPRSQLQSLAIEAVAQDALAQRAGRCGRLAPGICIRLFDASDFDNRDAETAPEILRSNLADVVLQMADRRLGAPEDFPFVDPPDRRLLRDAQRLLEQLQALRSNGSPTPTGKRMARIPVEPRFARMLVEAERLHCLASTVIVVAALSMPDVREVGPEQREAARQCHAPWRDPQSDFGTLLNMHAAIETAREQESRKGFEKWCRQNFLSARRVREWNDLVHQIHRELRAAGFKREPGSADRLHRALLVGLLDHIGQHHENGEFRGPRGTRWFIHPDSALKKCRKGWVFCASIVTTQRTLARTVARTDAATLLAAAGPLVRKEALEPHWDPKRGEVMCTEQCRLFGMVVDNSKHVPFARYDTEAAREIFVREALVNGNWGLPRPPDFLAHNRRQLAHVRAEEDRLRRRDLLIDDDEHAALYLAGLPAEVHNRQQLLALLDDQVDAGLRFSDEQLRARQGASLADAWPGEVRIRGQMLRLKYRFAPGDPDDGVTVQLPLEALAQLRSADFDGCVPGLAEQQLDALLRQLPKSDRRKLIPISDTIAEISSGITFGPDFFDRLRLQLEKRLGHPIPAEALLTASLPENLQLRFAIRGRQKRPLAAGRNLEALRAQLAAPAKQAASEVVSLAEDMQRPLLRFPDPAPEWLQRSPRGTPLRIILRDHGDSARLEVCGDPDLADRLDMAGRRRLAWLHLKSKIGLRLKPLKKLRALRHFADAPNDDWEKVHGFIGARPDNADESADGLIQGVALSAIGALPGLEAVNRADFEDAINRHWPTIDERLLSAARALEQMAPTWDAVRLKLAVEPVDSPLRHTASLLMGPGFPARVDDWAAMPRYLDALASRFDKRQRNPGLDHDREQQVQTFERRLMEYMSNKPSPQRAATVRHIYWALQDFRVQQFAQELGVPHAVSPKRINQLFIQLVN